MLRTITVDEKVVTKKAYKGLMGQVARLGTYVQTLQNAIRVGAEIYTCCTCPSKFNFECPYAWDDYNTNGDCLAEK